MQQLDGNINIIVFEKLLNFKISVFSRFLSSLVAVIFKLKKYVDLYMKYVLVL